ncbi:hypothetical protein GDO86_008385 [Hymenochirus boettgeri]|uniref:Uncharacterized protein n=1 Tax=Hymenochirus boettgeri TaxID=247094 RepID=A0A8T2J1Q5_9PIPI|nr:hypothetical protein GDO86_008385 [Hymenochirus boettgeri]
MSLYTVVSLDTSQQTLITYTWFSLSWENDFITWNPNNFCGIDYILIRGENLWIPDMYIYEMTEADDKNTVIPYFRIESNGTIKSDKPLRIISSCNIEIFKFPFDIQICNLTFGPYVHTEKDIIMIPRSNSLEVHKNSLDIFVTKGDWTLLDVAVSNNSIDFGGDTFSKVTYMVTIKRASVVYIINLIIPACFLVLLDIASMFIQMGTEERLGFKVTIVLGFSVLLLILNDMVPNSDSPPVLGIFCTISLAVMVISIIGSIITNYMLTLSSTQPNVPQWIKIWILKRLARVLLFKIPLQHQHLVVHVDTDKDLKERDDKLDIERRDKQNGSVKVTLEVKLLKRLLFEVLQIHRELNLSKMEEKAKSEWYLAALIVDRLVLFMYLCIVFVMFTIVIIVWAK